ncbi:MAG: exonuclease SbcCD subunit D [Ruminococcus sp.]|nr:exonuclease SbcCD subunit D [Candidatus Apopatosoma intestinale]
MPKILHIADVHLDAPFSLLDLKKAQARKSELRGTFSSAVMYAKMEKVDLCLIAGDLFDGGFVTKETMSLLISQFESAPDVRFIITPGNHDYYSSSSPYAKTKFPENVYVFTDDTLTRLRFDDINTDVYGYAFTSDKMATNPLATRPGLDPLHFNILVGHADLDAGIYCPVTRDDLSKSGFDYAALGHIHLGGDVQKAGNTYYAYSGCLEGRSFDECGIKGGIVADVDFDGLRRKIHFKPVRFCKRHYERLTVDVTGAENNQDIAEKIRAGATAAGFGTDTLLRVRLRGNVPVTADLRPERIEAETVGAFYLEIKDTTAPLIGYETLKNDITVRGAFFRELLPLLESENEDERRSASLALRYGLAALAGENVIDY